MITTLNLRHVYRMPKFRVELGIQFFDYFRNKKSFFYYKYYIIKEKSKVSFFISTELEIQLNLLH